MREFLLPLLFQYDSIDYGYGGDVDDVANGTFEVGEVDGFVKSHLDGTDDFTIVGHTLNHLITTVCRGEVGEDEGVDVKTAEAREGIFFIAKFAVEGKVYLHFTVDGEFGEVCLHAVNNLVNYGW